MTKVSKRTIVIAMATILALVVCAAPAYAYFTKTVEANGEKQITLEYSGEIKEEPGDGYKNIWMENTGESDIIAEVRIVGAKSFDNITIEVKGNSAWSRVSSEGGGAVQVWRYVGGSENGVLHPGESTPKEDGCLRVDITYPDAPEGSTPDYPAFDILVEGHYYPVFYEYDENGNPQPQPFKRSLVK